MVTNQSSQDDPISLRWRHNERDGVSNHQPHDCLFDRLFRHISKKTSMLRITGFCAGNSPVTGEFLAQRASNAKNVSTWWRHHVMAISPTSVRSCIDPNVKNRPEKHICSNCVNPHRFVHIFPHDTTNNHDYSLYHCLISTTRSREMIWVYWTGVKIITCTLSKVTWYSQSVPGLFAGTLGVSQWNLLWQTNRPIKSSLLAPARPRRFSLKPERTKRMIRTVNVQQLF